MRLLPHWVLSDKFPAFYDSESATAIEQTAKLYAAVNELIAEYNKFVDGVNLQIKEFIDSSHKDFETFTVGIRQEFQDFIDVVELKIKAQDKEISDRLSQQDEDIANAISYMKSNLHSSIVSIINEMRENGELTQDLLDAFEELQQFIENFELKFLYDEESKALTILAVNGTDINKEIVTEYNADNKSLTLSL